MSEQGYSGTLRSQKQTFKGLLDRHEIPVKEITSGMGDVCFRTLINPFQGGGINP
jgi:hypothetical protein